ncbi:MAG: 50S ribosomal protein L11 methyltransferase [Acidobacteria bacterium]|nr:50S ribosomal protein L11 methyltransferase [Acidobacteriota bacterium]
MSLLSLRLQCDIDAKDSLIAELYGLGTTGIVEREELGGECFLEAFFGTQDEVELAASLLAALQPELVDHGARDYVREFQDHWQPLAVGKRLWLAPPWDASPAPDDRLRVEYQAGMACGSGAHPCTQLCLEALEEAVAPGARVVDVGVGSGILLMASKALGAGLVAGCDIDHDAVAIAREATGETRLFTGSARSLRSAAFDVVVANISAEAVETMLGELRRIAAPGARVIVSGFREGDLPGGLGVSEVHQRDGWACAVLQL